MSLLIELKNLGNDHFRSGNYLKAIQCYSDAIDQFGPDPILYSNRAQCFIKLLLWQKAVKDTVLGLELKSSLQIRLKLLFRQGVALCGSGNYTDAEFSLQTILELDPDNKDAQKQLEFLLGPKLKKLRLREDVRVPVETVSELPSEFANILNVLNEK